MKSVGTDRIGTEVKLRSLEKELSLRCSFDTARFTVLAAGKRSPKTRERGNRQQAGKRRLLVGRSTFLEFECS